MGSATGGLPPIIANVVQQLNDLTRSVGTGALPSGGPADALLRSSKAIDAAHGAHRDGMAYLPPSLNGRTGEAALTRAVAVQNSATQLSDRGTTIARVLGNASDDVSAASAKLDGITQDFVSTATKAGPELATGNGIAMIAAKAQQSLSQAIGVINDTQTKLQDHAATMNGLLPEPNEVPPAVRPGAAPPAPGATAPIQNLITQGGKLAGTITGGAGKVLGSMSNAAQNAISNAEKALQTGLRGRGPELPPTGSGGLRIPNDHTILGQGVQVKLPDGHVVVAPNEKAAAAVRAALGQRGVPYVWGGESPGHSFDCSGLTKYAYSQAGVELPHSAVDQRVGPSIDRDHLMPGDLAVWSGHVAMVVGNGRMIEAGDPVEISPIRTDNEGMDFYGFYRPTA